MDQPETETLEAAMKALSMGEYERGERIFSKLIMSGSNMSGSLYGLGLVRLHFGQVDAALGQFEGCVKLDPRHANAMYYLGVIAEKKGQQEAAQNYYRKCLEIQPQHVGAARKVISVQPPPIPPGPPEVHPPTPSALPAPVKENTYENKDYSSDFYALLRKSNEPVEKEISSHLDSIAAIMNSRRQRATGLLSGFVITLLALDGGIAAALLVNTGSSSEAGFLAAFALVSLLCCLAFGSRLLRALTTSINCVRDWLIISNGILHKSETPLPIWLLRESPVSTDQTLINRLTGDGRLKLGKFVLKGFFTPHELASLSAHFRTLSMLNPVGREVLAAIGELRQIRSGTN